MIKVDNHQFSNFNIKEKNMLQNKLSFHIILIKIKKLL